MPGSTETRPGPRPRFPAPYIMSQLEDRIRADLNEIVSLALTSAEQTRGHVQAEVEDMQRWASVLLAAGMIVGTWAGNSVGAVDHPADGAYRSSHAAAV